MPARRRPVKAAFPPARTRATRRRVPSIDPVKHLDWGRMIGRVVCEHYRFLTDSQEEDDLISVAHVALCQHAKRFDFSKVPAGGDPDGQFRGWSHKGIRKLVEQEAIRLLNGGTYYTRREWEHQEPVRVGPLPAPRCANCADVTLALGRTASDGWSTLVSNCDTTLYQDRRRPAPVPVEELL